MNPTRRASIAALLGFAAAPAFAASPVNFPGRAVTIIVPFGVGGVADITARIVGQAMAKSLGQPVIIDNRPSAGNIVGSAMVARSAPDGYTLLLLSNGNAISSSLFARLPYDVVKDFAPVGTLGFFDLALFVPHASRFANLRDLLADAKASPGKLTIGTIAAGSTQNLAAEMFRTMAGIDALIVPYNGTPALQTALLAGQLDVGFEVLGPMLSQLKPDGLRALAVTSGRRFAGLPEVPTVQESGLAGYDVASWNALAAPARTQPAVLDRLNAAVRQAVETPDVRQRLLSLGVRAQAGTREQLSQLLASEIRRWGEVIASAKIPVR
ncbi:Argininosuccinate lyase [Variovorax sp. SRS16]|uniref:tripartite tricarboxylate transporter substrate binding protein n=1 Tax=Variovorax sp. SRS16 TaxID=282217 RepID=UPI001318963D|nr:tripartite tricarboxylate transporter substrate binding protein [Variovorax sp. SRS16]VTU23754.1 Argininosuccinate lyase [Variovorax sp. SRS16]